MKPKTSRSGLSRSCLRSRLSRNSALLMISSSKSAREPTRSLPYGSRWHRMPGCSPRNRNRSPHRHPSNQRGYYLGRFGLFSSFPIYLWLISTIPRHYRMWRWCSLGRFTVVLVMAVPQFNTHTPLDLSSGRSVTLRGQGLGRTDCGRTFGRQGLVTEGHTCPEHRRYRQGALAHVVL